MIDLAMQYDAVQAKLVMRVMLAGWQRGESFWPQNQGTRSRSGRAKGWMPWS